MEDIRTLPYDILWDIWEGQPITDINFRNYDLVIEYMWEKSFLTNRIYTSLGLTKDKDMKKIYTDYVRHILRNECSIMMLNEDETQILAVVLLEWMTDEWHSWVYLTSSVPSGKFQQLLSMKKDLVDESKRVAELKNFDCLTIHELYLPTELYLNKSFLMPLFDVFAAVAQHMYVPRVVYPALSNLEQDAASVAEYETLGEIVFSIYKVGNTLPFDSLREIDEMYAVLFAVAVVPINHYELLPGFESFHAQLKAKQLKDQQL